MGSSMGALISLYGIIEYPEIFGGAAAVSTHWPSSMMLDNPEANEPIHAHAEEAIKSAPVRKYLRTALTKRAQTRSGSLHRSELATDRHQSRPGTPVPE